MTKKKDVAPPPWLLIGKKLRIGDRVVPCREDGGASPVQARVTVGTVVGLSGPRTKGYWTTATVQWDEYKRPHSYAVCFVEKASKRAQLEAKAEKVS